MRDEAVVFVSDAHFGSGPGETERRRSFCAYLATLHGIARLVIVGDLFQFWFDLGGTIPQRSFDILAALHDLRRSGTRIDYLAGNHDYWRGDFFRRELGVETARGPLELSVQGRRILVLHGDGEGPGDSGYKLLRAIVRSPLTVAVARLCHPDLLLGLARAAGTLSRAHTERRPADRRRLDAVARAGFARGFDAVVLGHVHLQLHERLPGGELLVVGDWLELRSYVRLEGGVFRGGRYGVPDAPSA
jgi:UDP-2,3-diacylglucosamine hydrolase